MAIKANETDGNLVISLEGRIDSVNAPQVEKDIHVCDLLSASQTRHAVA